MASFADRMRELRTEKGLKKTDVARGTGLSRSAVTKYESGERDNPTLPILLSISEFFDVSLDYLVGESNIRDRDVSNKTLSEIFFRLSDENKIQLVKYAKYLEKEQSDGQRISD